VSSKPGIIFINVVFARDTRYDKNLKRKRMELKSSLPSSQKGTHKTDLAAFQDAWTKLDLKGEMETHIFESKIATLELQAMQLLESAALVRTHCNSTCTVTHTTENESVPLTRRLRKKIELFTGVVARE
jgi:hypothetical protein